MSEWTITIAPPKGLHDTVAAFEAAWLEGDGADVNDYLPLPDDPDYDRILRDLIRLDLRLSWAADLPHRLADFIDTHPRAFDDREWVSAMALEEFRARTAAGEKLHASGYHKQFGVDVSGWRTRRTFLRPSSDPGDPRQTDIMAIPVESRPGRAIVPTLPRAGQAFLDFDLIRELGRGVFGRVFLARQRELAGRPVALKVTTEIDTEPQTLARLQHTNIVPIYSVVRHGPLQAICMPYFGSVTLAQVIRTVAAEGRLNGTGRRFLSTLFEMRVTVSDDVRQATGGSPSHDGTAPVPEEPPSLKALANMTPVEVGLWIGARLADGLAHAHERGVLHCDLKPANVLLADDGQPMLLDFNVAANRQGGSSAKVQRLGGTLPYMAPEHLDLIAGQGGTLTPQCDLYSLGVVLYELLTGTQPFDEPNGDPAQMIPIYRDLHSRLPLPPSDRNHVVSPAVDAIVLKLLDPDPAKRYADAAQVREDLERQLAHRPLAFAPDRSVPERIHKWQRRHPRLSVGLAVGFAAIAFLIAPATVLAVRQNQLAERRHEIARSEAILAQKQAVRDLRHAQTLLSGRAVDKSYVLDGLAKARAVIEQYGIEVDAGWATRSHVTLLSERQQTELRTELGETLLMMARAEQALGADGDADAAAAGLRWNVLAERAYPDDQMPRMLATQRARLLALAPGKAEPLADPGPGAANGYHEGMELALADEPGKGLLKLMPYTDEHPDHFLAWYARGVCHERVGQFADAAAAFTVCATLWPDFAPCYFGRGYARLKQGRPEAAEADFTRALVHKPAWTQALLNRSIAREVLKDYAGAEADLTAVLERPDAPTKAYFMRAKVRKALGNAAGAEADLAEGKSRIPTDESSWLTRGFWNLSSDPAKALADYEEAIKVNPKSRDGWQSKAVILADYLKRPADAVVAMDRLLELYPTHTDARAGRGVYLARIGDAKRATADAAWVLKEDPTAYRHFQMAGLYALLSKHDERHKAEALRLLARSFQLGFSQFDKLDRDADLDAIRGDESFQSMVEHARKLRAQ
jgi:serine/threonine protein kinase/Tfp pilus assembly protein PilF